MRIIPETRIDFVGRRGLFFVITGAFIVAAVVALVLTGLRWGVDFTGGSRFQVKFERPVRLEAMRAALTAIGEGGASIQQDQRGDFILRIGATASEGDQEALRRRVEDQLRSSFEGNQTDISVDAVGPQVSRELKNRVLLAIGLGLLGILVYVSFRFDFRFGLAAILSLLFVAVVALGFIAVVRTEVTITVVAAVLTALGYGVNDSIVVSDRIREDVKKMRKEPFNAIVNKALNETLNRTVVTGISVFFVLFALLALGAASIKDFAAVMVVGLLASTYSSIFVVANTVVEWETRFPSKRRR